MTIRVVVADDQDLVRTGLEMMLATRGLDVVGSAADGRSAIEVVCAKDWAVTSTPVIRMSSPRTAVRYRWAAKVR